MAELPVQQVFSTGAISPLSGQKFILRGQKKKKKIASFRNKAQTYTQYVKEIYMVSMILKSQGAWDNYKIMS